MKHHLLQIDKKIIATKKMLMKDDVLKNDIDFTFNFIPPYSKADEISDIKLIIIGQDPTVRRIESRSEIKFTLNLDRENSLKTYLKNVCNTLRLDIDKEVYATNLYKCFFNIPPADDESILTRHFKPWMDLLINEVHVFNNPIVISLGEPLLKQLTHVENNKVKHYWDYIGNTKSGCEFKYLKQNENYLQKRIYPLAHQPTWSRNIFYKTYLKDYLKFINKIENKALMPKSL